MDTSQKFLALLIPHSWHFTILVKAHNESGHQGVNRIYQRIKWQYYWKCMNKDICKYIANSTICKREKTNMQMYALQMMDIPDQPFNMIAIDLITHLNISTSGNQQILTIIDHLTGWSEACPIPNKKVDTIIHVFIKTTLWFTCSPGTYYLIIEQN